MLPPPADAPASQPSLPALIQARPETSLTTPVRRIKWTAPDGAFERWANAHWPEFPQLARSGAGKYRGVYLSRVSIGLAASVFMLFGGVGVLAVSALAEGSSDTNARIAFAKTLPVVTATAITPSDGSIDATSDGGTWVKQNQDRVEPRPARAAASNEPRAKAPVPAKPETTASIAASPEKTALAEAAPSAADKSATTRELAQPGYLRAAPNGRMISVVPKGEEVEVRNCSMWCLVSYKGQQGYVFKSLLRDANAGKADDEKTTRRRAT